MCGEAADCVRRELASRRRVAGEAGGKRRAASSVRGQTAICRLMRTPLILLAMW